MVIGTADRPPTADELKQMEIMVDDAMSDGAMGLSSALIYAPGSYAKTDELIALAKVAAKKGGIYASHIRGEGDSEMDALDEAFRIGREAGIPIEIFHLKVAGMQNWGKMPQVIAAIEQARASGIDVTADQYPYIGAATSLGASIPPKYHEGGVDEFVKRLKNPAIRQQIRKDLDRTGGSFENLYREVGGADGVLVVSVLDPKLRQYESKTVAQIAKTENKDPIDALIDLVIADRDNVGAVYFLMSEPDVKLAMQQPWVSVGTDYGAINPTGPLGESKAHPRAYGSFAAHSRQVRRRGARPAPGRRDSQVHVAAGAAREARPSRPVAHGLLRRHHHLRSGKSSRPGDLRRPNKPSVGFEYVFVNGTLALEHDKVTGQLGGRPLRGPGYIMRDYLPEGLPPRGKVQGVVTDEGGWPTPRATVTLTDASGKVVGTAHSKRNGSYQIILEKPCNNCLLKAEHMGFATQQRSGVDYNGSMRCGSGLRCKGAIAISEGALIRR